jgi:hypothetical protein
VITDTHRDPSGGGMGSSHTLARIGTRPRTASLRVRPGTRGAWRVEDEAGTRGRCATFAEAELLAEQILHDLGGGQILVYDAYQRLRTVKRLPPRAH